MDEDDLLSGQSVSSEQRTHEVIQALLSDRPLDYFTEEDVTLVENAVKKIQTGLEVAKKNILTDEDILGVSGIQMQSAPSSMSISRTSASTSNSVSDESQMEFDLDLDYDEYISEAQLPDDPREGSVTPRNMSNGSVICLSSDSGSSYSHKIKNPKNLPNIVFSRKLNRENQYLKLKKLKPPVDISKLDFVYPLGVTFDRESSTWFVADKMKNSVVKIYSGSDRRGRGYCEMKGPYLNNPTAITVLKEGSKVAILCAEAACKPVIRLLDIRSEGSGSITEFCSWKNECLDFNYQARGLARSLGGNLLTTDRPFKGSPRLRVFTKSHRHKTYVLESAELPSFIASSGSTVVITDLGKEQTVLHCRLDDSDFDRTSFQVLRTISTTGVNLKAHEMINKQYFMYVAGAQIDRNGNILIADARNRHFKLFKPSMGFIHRVSTDFPVPYVSSFHVNEDGEMLILSTRNEKVSFARLTATNRLEPHIAGAIGQRPAEKSIFSKRLHRTHSRESIRSVRTVKSYKSGRNERGFE